ncbi:TPA: hypothetical protein UM690_002652 [Stenotrophomonas maltophilia]|nr:hypothetical protein [Stenotrophomonas maltophilia]HEL4289940.1 hypothetical protein [Stenotrophomonas maltophilia]
MEWLKLALSVLLRAIEFAADIGTIGASVIAAILFFRNGPEIKSLIRSLNNFAHRDSMSELRIKIELLASLRAVDQSNSVEISSLFLEICGQIDGSPFLRDDLCDISARMKSAASGRKMISEPQKRAMLSELREMVRHLDYANFEDSLKSSGELRK